MKTISIDHFDLQQIADSGQCFRMRRTDDLQSTSGVRWSVISGPRYLEIFQDGVLLSFDCPEEDFSFWSDYFDLGTDYHAFASSIRKRDSYLQEAAAAGSGIRILRQDVWEMIITFVISQQKTIPKIREAVEALSSRYGDRRQAVLSDGTIRAFSSFPRPDQLSRASLEDLTQLKLGYRAKYIHRICQDACQGRLDLKLLSSLSYEEALSYLTGFYGIGKKVANCICLFGLHHIDAFPVDTWIQQILTAHYYPKNRKKYRQLPKSQLFDALIRDYFGFYKGYSGVMQQYIFYYERQKQRAVK